MQRRDLIKSESFELRMMIIHPVKIVNIPPSVCALWWVYGLDKLSLGED